MIFGLCIYKIWLLMMMFVKTIYRQRDLAIVLHADSPLFLAAVTCTNINQ